MCDVCCASSVIDAAKKDDFYTFKWKSVKPKILVEADRHHTKFGDPEGSNRIRIKTGTHPWSKWFSTRDLAATMMRLGVDIRWEFVSGEVKAWLDGAMSTEDLIAYLRTRPKGPALQLSLSKEVADEIDTPEKVKEAAKDYGVTQKDLKRLLADAH